MIPHWLLRLDVWLLFLAFVVPPRKTFLAAFALAASWFVYRTAGNAPRATPTQLGGALLATLAAAALVRTHCVRKKKPTPAERARRRTRSHSFRFKRGSAPQVGSGTAAAGTGAAFGASRAAATAAALSSIPPPVRSVASAARAEGMADEVGSGAADVAGATAGIADMDIGHAHTNGSPAHGRKKRKKKGKRSGRRRGDDATRDGAGTSAGAGGAGAGAGAGSAAAATGDAADPRKTVTVPLSELPLGLPSGPSKGGKHCYCKLDATQFKVRGPNYKRDGVKVPSKPAVAELVHVDLFSAPERVGSLATHPDSYIQQAIAAGDKRFFICITFQSPGTESRVHMSLYYAMPVDGPDSVGDKPFARLWKQFLEGDDEFRNSRWKVIPSIAEGNWIVRRAVGSKPALLGTKLTHEWTVGKQYLDCSVDVASSSMASMLVGLIQQYAKLLVIDLGFVLQGEEGELPEHVLATVRLSRPDLAAAISLSR